MVDWRWIEKKSLQFTYILYFVVPCNSIKLTYVSFSAHIKIASRVVYQPTAFTKEWNTEIMQFDKTRMQYNDSIMLNKSMSCMRAHCV